MRIFNYALTYLLIAQPCFANKDRIDSWSSVTIQAERKVKVSANTKGNELRSLVMTLDGNEIAVPTSEFKGIKDVHLNSIQVLSGNFAEQSGKDIRPYRYVRLEFGKPFVTANGAEYSSVEFMFYKGKYQDRNVRRQTGPGTWEIEQKFPGLEETTRGHETQLE